MILHTVQKSKHFLTLLKIISILLKNIVTFYIFVLLIRKNESTI
jgi:hypothetical protein